MPKIKVKKAGAFVDLAPGGATLSSHGNVSGGAMVAQAPKVPTAFTLAGGAALTGSSPQYIGMGSASATATIVIDFGVNGGRFRPRGWESQNSIVVTVDGVSSGLQTRVGTGWYSAGPWIPVSPGSHTIVLSKQSGVSGDVTDLEWEKNNETFSYLSGVHAATLVGDFTVAFGTAPASVGTMRLIFKQDATGGRTITWPGSVVWAGGAPVPSKTANSYEVYEFTTSDGGVTWIGAFLNEAPSAVVPGALIGKKYHEPTVNETVLNAGASAAWAAIDTAKLRASFVAPASGEVVVKLSALQSTASGGRVYWGVLDGAALKGGAWLVDTMGSSVRAEAVIHVTGLTPGQTYTWDWAYKISASTHSLFAGNDAASPYGPASMEIFAVGAAIPDANLQTIIDALALVGQNTQADNYSLVLADAGKVVEVDKATAVNLTVPLNATQAFPIGTVIEVWAKGAGQVTIVPTGGVTIRSSGGNLKLYGQYSSASLRKRGTDEWVLVGDLVA